MSDRSDRLDYAALLETREREAVIDTHRQRRAREAWIAATGTGPTCEVCEEPIPPERRRALPHARRCVECQTWEERR